MRNVCLFGDCRESMRKMITEGVNVQTCVTSPPYWGLRDYGVAGQLGLESTPDEYVSNMVEVFGLVRDLLADDGTLWLNLGDSYFSASCTGSSFEKKSTGEYAPERYGDIQAGKNQRNKALMKMGYKAKDLVGIPWRVAFALQAAGWYLRSDIIWHKPNPMPESVTDRPTKAHEYLFLLAKRERYYYDARAISESAISDHASGNGFKRPERLSFDGRGNDEQWTDVGGKRNRRTVWTVATEPYSEAHFATFPTALIEPCILAGARVGDTVFDPFMGSGTTAQVAQKLGRNWLGCELNEKYGELQKRRTEQLGMALV